MMRPFETIFDKRWMHWLAGLVVGVLVGFLAAKLIEQYNRRYQSPKNA